VVKEESSQYGIMESLVRFIGQTEVSAFVAAWPAYADTVRAWLTEIKYRHWLLPAEMAEDFREVDVSNPPLIVFYLAPVAVRIETLINFRLGIVLLTRIDPPAVGYGELRPSWNIRRDH
jgi:mRNA-degrading endonuclease HigB of HigAB toxin-antitoxin module